jgi:hypothetical protein
MALNSDLISDGLPQLKESFSQEQSSGVFFTVDITLEKHELDSFGKRVRDQSLCFVVLAELTTSLNETTIDKILIVSDKSKDGEIKAKEPDFKPSCHYSLKYKS